MPTRSTTRDFPGDEGVVPIRVMIVDDHPVYRDGLAAVLASQDDLQLVAEAGNGGEAVQLFRVHRPDVTLMDLNMPGVTGTQAIGQIVAEFPDARIVTLTTFQGDVDIHRALEAGARGYLVKDALRDEVVDAIRAVYRKGWVLPNAVAQRLAEFVPRVELTTRELEVLELMAKGLRNMEIATILARTESTVKVHVQNIFSKLGAADRTEAVVVALERGFIHLS
jgi:two-component system, NarL family, response regulator